MAIRKVAREVLSHVLGARPGERLLVVTDEHRIEIGNAFYEAADALELEGKLFVLEDSERPLEEIPPELGRALEGAGIVLTLFVAYEEETPFRVKLLAAAQQAGARVGHGPGITDDMMRQGAMHADFKVLLEHAEALLARVAGAERLRLRGPGGTDLRLGIAGRRWVSDVVVEPGKYGNLPPGELWVAPVEDQADGTFVCDLELHDTGPVPKPIVFELSRGRVVSVRSEDQKLAERVNGMLSIDDQARVVGELGVGINEAARMTGNMLEDGKRAGMVRLALGNNEDIPGGANRSLTHIDLLLREPTLTVETKGGRTRTIVDKGELVE